MEGGGVRDTPTPDADGLKIGGVLGGAGRSFTHTHTAGRLAHSRQGAWARARAKDG